MSKDEAHAVKTIKQTEDVMPACADIHALKSEEQQYNVCRYCGDLGVSLSSMLSGQSSGQRWAQPSSHGVFNPWFG